jgi:hypothetical protein
MLQVTLSILGHLSLHSITWLLVLHLFITHMQVNGPFCKQTKKELAEPEFGFEIKHSC